MSFSLDIKVIISYEWNRVSQPVLDFLVNKSVIHTLID